MLGQRSATGLTLLALTLGCGSDANGVSLSDVPAVEAGMDAADATPGPDSGSCPDNASGSVTAACNIVE